MFTCVLGRNVACSFTTSTQTFRSALTAFVDSCVEVKSAPFSGVTNSGRVCRKVPESDARSVSECLHELKCPESKGNFLFYAFIMNNKVLLCMYSSFPFSSVQLSMVSMRSEKPICAPPASEVSPANVALYLHAS